MPDKIVYLIDDLPTDASEWPVTLVDSVSLAALIAAGWETSTTIPNRKVKHGKRTLQADMLILKQAADNRGVTVAGRPDSGSSEMVVLTDPFGGRREVSIAQATTQALQDVSRALALSGQHPGHLGAPSNHNFPGVTVIGGEMVAKALDIGMQAGFNGSPVTACPFPAGNPARMQWMKGWDIGAKRRANPERANAEELTAADQQGYDTAIAYGKDVEVSCPYRAPDLRDAWLQGFERGGGTILPPEHSGD